MRVQFCLLLWAVGPGVAGPRATLRACTPYLVFALGALHMLRQVVVSLRQALVMFDKYLSLEQCSTGARCINSAVQHTII